MWRWRTGALHVPRTTSWGYGFRDRDFVAPRNDEGSVAELLAPSLWVIRGTLSTRHSGARMARARNPYAGADVVMADWSFACASYHVLGLWIPGLRLRRAPE